MSLDPFTQNVLSGYYGIFTNGAKNPDFHVFFKQRNQHDVTTLLPLVWLVSN